MERKSLEEEAICQVVETLDEEELERVFGKLYMQVPLYILDMAKEMKIQRWNLRVKKIAQERQFMIYYNCSDKIFHIDLVVENWGFSRVQASINSLGIEFEFILIDEDSGGPIDVKLDMESLNSFPEKLETIYKLSNGFDISGDKLSLIRKAFLMSRKYLEEYHAFMK